MLRADIKFKPNVLGSGFVCKVTKVLPGHRDNLESHI